MPELRLDLPQHLVDAINDRINRINGNPAGHRLDAQEIGREALAVYKWTLDRLDEGLAVVAAGADGRPVLQITSKHLPIKRPTR